VGRLRAGNEDERREAWAVASDLTAHLLANFVALNSSAPDFATAAAAIPFVPVRGPRDPAAAATSLPPETLARFGDAAAEEDEALVWTAAPVLAVPAPTGEGVRRRLGLLSPPPAQTVVDHLTRLPADAPARWPLVERPGVCCQRVLAHLWGRWQELSQEQRMALQWALLVPVGGGLVRASRVFFRLSGGFVPFMFEVRLHPTSAFSTSGFPRIFPSHGCLP
jgi:hypothetical protein